MKFKNWLKKWNFSSLKINAEFLEVELTFDDNTTQTQVFPAQIWRINDEKATRTFATEKIVTKIVVVTMRRCCGRKDTNPLLPICKLEVP